MPVTTAADASASLLRQAGTTVFSMILFQTLSRGLTFLLNTALIRMTSPTVLGLAGLKLDLLLSTILYLARDGMRMAMVRMAPPKAAAADKRKWTRRLVNLVYLALAVGLLLALLLGLIYRRWPPAEMTADARLFSAYNKAILAYCGAALLELACEPMVALLMYHQRMRVRLSVEMLAMLGRISVILAYARACRPSSKGSQSEDVLLGLEAFSMGQLCHSVILLGAYLRVFWRQDEFAHLRLTDLLPSLSPYELDVKSARLAGEMTKQLFLKYALAQGDMWMVSTMCHARDQGVYSVVANYGSLVCRLLLQPLEESSLYFFSRTLRGRAQQSLRSVSRAEVEANLSEASKTMAALQHLLNILKLDTLLSLAFGLVAPFYTGLLVRILLGGQWADTTMPAVLAAYCLQIPPMAFCGILEAFMNATIATPAWFQTARRNSIAFSLIYVVGAFFLVRRFDTVGLIAASLLSFSMRAAQGFYYLLWYLDAISVEAPIRLSAMLPSHMVLAAFLLASLVSSLTLLFKGAIAQASLAAASGLILLSACYRYERAFIRSIRKTYVQRKAV
jgi:oligosaccharide translocation protein RFT1